MPDISYRRILAALTLIAWTMTGSVASAQIEPLVEGGPVAARGSELAAGAAELDVDRVARVAMSSGGTTRDIAAGVLASWRGRYAMGAALLRRALSHGRYAPRSEIALALHVLAFDAALAGRYAEAAKYGAELLAFNAHGLDEADLFDLRSQVELWLILRNQLPISAELHGRTRVSTVPNRAGRIEAMIEVDGRLAHALIDTGAENTVISEGLLRKLGTAIIPGETHDRGSTGVVVATKVAVLDRVRFGTAVLRNIPAGIRADEALVVGRKEHETRFDLIVGYPALRALGTMTVRSDGSLWFGLRPGRNRDVATLIERYQQAFVSGKVRGKAAAFLLDTGADKTMLTPAFRKAFPDLTKGAR